MDSAMKKILTFSVLAGLMLCGCQKEEQIIEKTPEQKVFTAEIESNSDDAATRTSLDNQGNVLWKVGDEVSIFAGNTVNAEYKVSEVTNGQTRAILSPVSSSETGTGANVAYYPYSSALSLATAESGYTISNIKLPAIQKYAQASFADGAFPMAAVSDNATLKFKNILGGLKLQLTGTAKVRSISVTARNGESLCGSANVTVSSTGDPSITLSDATATTVTLDCGTEGVQLDETTATPFIIALPPVKMTSGFTVTVTDTDGNTMDISTAKSKTIARSTLLPMKAVKFAGEDPSQKPFTITSVGNTTVRLVKEGSPAIVLHLEYRKNNANSWSNFTYDIDYTLSAGDVLQIRAQSNGNTKFAKDFNNYYYISTTGDGTIKASGNIMSLLDQNMKTTSVSTYAFVNFFRNNKKLTDASNLKLPATTLAEYCYVFMFYGCSALTTAPELPATTLANWCYQAMFQDCTSLTTAPELPAATLVKGCYYQMFRGCTALTTAPELPAETLVEYCYSEMFRYCSNLKYVKALFPKIPNYSYLENWLSGVSSTGTFVRNPAFEEETAKTWMKSWGISGWTTTTAE